MNDHVTTENEEQESSLHIDEKSFNRSLAVKRNIYESTVREA